MIGFVLVPLSDSISATLQHPSDISSRGYSTIPTTHNSLAIKLRQNWIEENYKHSSTNSKYQKCQRARNLIIMFPVTMFKAFLVTHWHKLLNSTQWHQKQPCVRPQKDRLDWNSGLISIRSVWCDIDPPMCGAIDLCVCVMWYWPPCVRWYWTLSVWWYLSLCVSTPLVCGDIHERVYP